MSNLDQLTSWHSNWRDLRAVVFGLGVSGFSVADTLAELGAKTLVVAEKAEEDLLDILDVIGVPHLTGEAARGVPKEVIDFKPDLIVVSPGIRPEHELLTWAANNAIEVWVDIDLAWRLRDKTERLAHWFTVTGTNGKTTTVQLLTAMLNSGGIKAEACGNIGKPILDAIRDPEGFDALVVELSSFQLHYLGQIFPFSSAVLNLADDHLDWHGGFEEYRAAKAKVYENTVAACVYNVMDKSTESMVEDADVVDGARAIGFTLGIPTRSQVGFVEDILCDRAFLDDRANNALEIATLDDINQIGVMTPHLMANVAAATAMARSAGVEPDRIRDAIRTFRLDAHRIELVAEADGIRWIDDSKATNPHAANASLASFDRVVWIVGGLLKGVDISSLVERHKSSLAAAIVIGADRSAVLDALAAKAPQVPVVEITADAGADVMQAAVQAAGRIATSGEVVLLAPAAASMDQFKDYADRGNRFAEAVRSLIGGDRG
ncbi:MAG: UDP-N-acetylmuramoyl-L-alanine--D-glutamate ligase [Rhodoluna sp.]|nr:UDP-N-acetylmuramoyl-L-alanine--D-glutamate ligase [Rhodoluna sp.]